MDSRVKDCSVRLERIPRMSTDKQNSIRCFGSQPLPVRPIIPPGKQMSLLRKTYGRGRGRPKKCMIPPPSLGKVTSSSGAPARTFMTSDGEERQKNTVKHDVYRGNGVNYGYGGISRGKSYFHKPPSGKILMKLPRVHDPVPSPNHLYSQYAHAPSPYSYFSSPFISRGHLNAGGGPTMHLPIHPWQSVASKPLELLRKQQQLHKNAAPLPRKRPARPRPTLPTLPCSLIMNDTFLPPVYTKKSDKLQVPSVTPSVAGARSGGQFSSKNNNTTMSMGRVRSPKIKERKDNIVSNSQEDGNSWVNELLSTNLADEVISEALNECYMPDISVIQDLTEDDIELIISEDVTTLPTSSSSPIGPMLMSLRANMMSSPLNLQGNGTNSLQSIPPPSSRTKIVPRRPFEFYEELYKNDILLIDAEEEELPLPS